MGAGGCLLGMGVIRVYRLIRFHSENPIFAPQLLLAALSLWIASIVFRVGLKKAEISRRDAISLIRSGSLLMMIWGYRIYLLNRTGGSEGLISVLPALIYCLLGGGVMGLGLKISRSTRKDTAAPETEK